MSAAQGKQGRPKKCVDFWMWMTVCRIPEITVMKVYYVLDTQVMGTERHGRMNTSRASSDL